jgi:SAM-dependent methyltransferase
MTGEDVTMSPTRIIRRTGKLLSNIMRDLRHGGSFLGGTVPTRYAHLGAVETANTDYLVLEAMFSHVDLQESDLIVDLGCGKGRVMNFLLDRTTGCKIAGVELDPDIAAGTARRLRKYDRVKIICGDVREKMPADGTVFYMYHPFDDKVLRDVITLMKNIRVPGRPVIVYFNAVHLDLFQNDPYWETTLVDLPGFDEVAAIIRPSA